MNSWRDGHDHDEDDDGATLDDLLPYLKQFVIGQIKILAVLTEMRNTMASAAEQLDALSAAVDDIAADVQVLVDKSGQLDAEGQAALDRLTGKLNDLNVEVGDQDGSDSAQPTA